MNRDPIATALFLLLAFFVLLGAAGMCALEKGWIQ